MTLIYINEVLVDIDYKTKVTVTLKAGDIGKINAAWVNFTNVFLLPYTKTNDSIFGNARYVLSGSNKPYTLLNVKVVQDGIEQIVNGRLVLVSCHGGYEVAIFENGGGFYETIKGKYIHEIRIADYGDLDDTFLAARLNATTAIMCPVMDYGYTDVTSGYINILAASYLPVVNYFSILNAIVNDSGIPGLSSWAEVLLDLVNTNGGYCTLGVPVGRPNMEYPEAFVKGYEVHSFVDGTQVITLTPGFTNDNVTFQVPLEGLNSLGLFDGETYSAGTGTGTNSMELSSIKVRLVIDVVVGAGETLTVRNLTNTANDSFINATGTYTIDQELTNEMILDGVSKSFLLRMVTTGIANNIVITVREGEFYVKANPKPMGKWNYCAMLPDMLQTDFIADFLARFFLISYQRYGTMYAKPFDDITYANPVDWTDKHDASIDDEILFSNQSFARTTRFKNRNDIGNGSILIDNYNLAESVDYYISPFNAPNTKKIFGINMASIEIFDNTSTGNTDPRIDMEPHIVCIREDADVDSEVRYNSVVKTNYQVATFLDVYMDMTWDGFINRKASKLAESLQENKIINRYYVLNDLDIKQFDPLRCILDKGALYFVNQIERYKSGESTKVQLFKIK